MARTLVLLRHAKTEQSHPGGDQARELAPRGVADAQVLGRWLADEGWLPDLVLSSPAVRARQTAEHALAGAGAQAVQVRDGRGLYESGADGVLSALHEVPEVTNTLWVVGHHPVMGIAATALADPQTSDQRALRTLGEGFATASCAVLETQSTWEQLQAGLARLVVFHTARA